MLNLDSIFILVSSATTQVVESAAKPIAITKSETVSNVASLANMIGGLMVVLAIIFVLAYVVRKLNLVPSSNSVIKTIAVSSLGQREKVVLVEVQGQQYLLGVTSHQINLIDKINPDSNFVSQSFSDELASAKEAQ